MLTLNIYKALDTSGLKTKLLKDYYAKTGWLIVRKSEFKQGQPTGMGNFTFSLDELNRLIADPPSAYFHDGPVVLEIKAPKFNSLQEVFTMYEEGSPRPEAPEPKSYILHDCEDVSVVRVVKQ